jgi:ABC-2 type transport system ATP-binding protein
MLLGLLPQTAGTMSVLGLDPEKENLNLKKRIGYVPEKHNFYKWMTVHKTLDFVSRVYPGWDWQECKETMDILGLSTNGKVKSLSRGELAKLALTIALSHKPDLLILDEPTSGLDPIIRRDFLEAIIRLVQREERTVFFSTHLLSDVERIADDVIILNNGSVLVADNLESLKSRYTQVSFLFSEKPSDELAIPDALSVKKGIREWIVNFEGKREDEIRTMCSSINAEDCMISPMTFENIFLELLAPGEADES